MAPRSASFSATARAVCGGDMNEGGEGGERMWGEGKRVSGFKKIIEEEIVPHYTTLHYTTQHYVMLHYITLHYITPNHAIS